MRTTTPVLPAACTAALLLASLAHAQPCGQCDWTEIALPSAPAPRFSASMVYDDARDRLVLFGGFAGSIHRNETWEYDFATAQWILRQPAQRPGARSSAAMVYDTQRKRTILFGGASVVSSDDTWVWDGTNWTELTTIGAPPRREYHAMVYDPTRDVVVLYGGLGIGVRYDDTWEFSPVTGTWTEVSTATSPGPREQHAMAFDSLRARPILFGGGTGSGASGGTWEYVVNGGVHEWVNRTNAGPNGRYSASMVADSARGRVLLFGGIWGGMFQDDLWEWNGATATWTQLTPPSTLPGCAGYAWAFCTARGTAYLHGGLGNGSAVYGETWQLAFPQSPIITSHPASTTAGQGDAAVLRVKAAGVGLTYQWRRGGQPLAPSSRHLGVTTPTLTILGFHTSDIGDYDVVVTNACGMATSTPATISLACDANCDGSTTPPVLNVNDFLCFQQKFAAGCP